MAITQDSRYSVLAEQSFGFYDKMHRVTCDFCGHADEETRGAGLDNAAEAARKAGWRTVFPSLASPAKWKCPSCQRKS